MIKVLYFCKECDIALKALKYIKKQKKYALQGCFISKLIYFYLSPIP